MGCIRRVLRVLVLIDVTQKQAEFRACLRLKVKNVTVSILELELGEECLWYDTNFP